MRKNALALSIEAMLAEPPAAPRQPAYIDPTLYPVPLGRTARVRLRGVSPSAADLQDLGLPVWPDWADRIIYDGMR